MVDLYGLVIRADTGRGSHKGSMGVCSRIGPSDLLIHAYVAEVRGPIQHKILGSMLGLRTRL